MKTTATVTAIDRTGVGESGTFKIKASAKAFKILSDGLYTDKIRAVVRELGSNAWDAHIAAGTTDRPFDVHLPNKLEPWYHIRDYGIGLCHADMMHLYSTYFESTKSDSNDFTGALGLGSKSPFSYAEAFTVTSWFDGQKSVYIVDLGEDGVPSIHLVNGFPEASEEHPGLLIKMAVKQDDFRDFENKSRDVYKRYPVFPNVIGVADFNLKEITYLLEGKEWRLIENDPNDYYGSAKSTALQGTVAYPIQVSSFTSSEYGDRNRYDGLGIEIFFEMGELDVVANREGLSYDDRTTANIKAKFEAAFKDIAASVSEKLNDCKSLWEARCKYRELTQHRAIKTLISRGTVKPTWKGHTIDDRAIGIRADTELSFVSFNRTQRSYGGRVMRRVELNLKHNEIRVIPSKNIHFILDDLKVGSRARIKEYAAAVAPNDSRAEFYLIRFANNSRVGAMKKELGLKWTDFKKASELPKAAPVVTGPAVVNPKHMIELWKYDSEPEFNNKEAWVGQGRVDVRDGGYANGSDTYYLQIHGGSMDASFYNSDMSESGIITTAFNIGMITAQQRLEIIGVNRTGRVRFTNNSKGYTDLYKALKEYVTKGADAMVADIEQKHAMHLFSYAAAYSRTKVNNINKLAKHFKDTVYGAGFIKVDQLTFTPNSKASSWESAINYFKVETKISYPAITALETAYKEVLAKYPMMTMIIEGRSIDTDKDLEIVSEYVKMADRFAKTADVALVD